MSGALFTPPDHPSYTPTQPPRRAGGKDKLHSDSERPQVTLKAAVTLDGKMAGRTGDSKWITGEKARREAHRLRARHDAVLVGVGTVLADDPQLTVRHVRGRDPLRVVLDSALRTPPGCKLLEGSSPAATWIFHGHRASKARRHALQRRGAQLFAVRKAERGLDLHQVLRTLAERGVTSILVEGGPRVHGACLDAGLADRATVFVAPRILGDARGKSFAEGRGTPKIADAWRIEAPKVRRLGVDVMICGTLERRTG